MFEVEVQPWQATFQNWFDSLVQSRNIIEMIWTIPRVKPIIEFIPRDGNHLLFQQLIPRLCVALKMKGCQGDTISHFYLKKLKEYFSLAQLAGSLFSTIKARKIQLHRFWCMEAGRTDMLEVV
ncbi:hypothetical protein AMTRI_Chr11g154160 [Amborella trichopoda]